MSAQCSECAWLTTGVLILRVLGRLPSPPPCVERTLLPGLLKTALLPSGFPSCPISRSSDRTWFGKCSYSPHLLPPHLPLILLAFILYQCCCAEAGLGSAALLGPWLVFWQRLGAKCYWNFQLIEFLTPPSLKCLPVQIAPVFQRLRSEATSSRKPSLSWIPTVFCLYSYPGSATY